jgi:hypothetical protein
MSRTTLAAGVGNSKASDVWINPIVSIPFVNIEHLTHSFNTSRQDVRLLSANHLVPKYGDTYLELELKPETSPIHALALF